MDRILRINASVEDRNRARAAASSSVVGAIAKAAASAVVFAAVASSGFLSSSSSLSSSLLFASAQPVPARQWSYNISDPAGPLNWGTILNTDGDVLYPSCFMDEFPAPRRFHDVHLKQVKEGNPTLKEIRLDYLVSNHFKIELKNSGTSRPSLTVSVLDIQCTTRHPETSAVMALQRIEFLIPAENEMGYINALEVHLIHAELDANNVAIPSSVKPEFVIATFYDGVITGGTPEMSKILAYAPQNGDGAVEVTTDTLDASLLFPAKRDYIYFKGVTPRPPCDVVTHYALLTQNLYLSTAAMQTLRTLLFGARLAADSNQRNAALVTVRNKAALSATNADYSFYSSLKATYPIPLPPGTEPFAIETSVAIAGFIVGGVSGLMGLTALVFALCRPRTRLTAKKEDPNAAAAAATAAAAAKNAENNGNLNDTLYRNGGAGGGAANGGRGGGANNHNNGGGGGNDDDSGGDSHSTPRKSNNRQSPLISPRQLM